MKQATCLALIHDTDTGDTLLRGPFDPAAATLKAPDGEGVIRIPVEQVATMLYGLGPDTRTAPAILGREVLA